MIPNYINKSLTYTSSLKSFANGSSAIDGRFVGVLHIVIDSSWLESFNSSSDSESDYLLMRFLLRMRNSKTTSKETIKITTIAMQTPIMIMFLSLVRFIS